MTDQMTYCAVLEPFYITALGVAQLRVQQAITFIEGILKNDNPNQHYAAVLDMLFGGNQAEIREALSIFRQKTGRHDTLTRH
jgi:hypothetical protein